MFLRSPKTWGQPLGRNSIILILITDLARMPSPQWQFAARFRRNAFGWKSDTPILRLKEALAEIKSAARAIRFSLPTGQ